MGCGVNPAKFSFLSPAKHPSGSSHFRCVPKKLKFAVFFSFLVCWAWCVPENPHRFACARIRALKAHVIKWYKIKNSIISTTFQQEKGMQRRTVNPDHEEALRLLVLINLEGKWLKQEMIITFKYEKDFCKEKENLFSSTSLYWINGDVNEALGKNF